MYRHIVIHYASDIVLAQYKLYRYIEYRDISNIVCDIIHVLTLMLHNTCTIL